MKKVLLLTVFSFSFSFSSAQTEIEKVTSTITQEEIKGHVYFLADDLLDGRSLGSRGIDIAASYLANTLRGYGVKPNPETGSFYQDVPLRITQVPKSSFFINEKQQKNFVMVSIAALDYNNDLVYLNYGLSEDYTGKNVKGKLILIKAGTRENSESISAWRMIEEKKKRAQKAGALGVVEIVKADNNTWDQIEKSVNSKKIDLIEGNGANETDPFPYLWIKENLSEQEEFFNSTAKLNADLKIYKPIKDRITSKNVIGYIEGNDPKLKDEYLIYSAHYDHLGIGPADITGDSIYNGARDNAVGTATVLSMADNLSRYPTKRSAIFLFFTGEEEGLLGSRYYVKNPVIPLKKVVFVFNCDNGGYNDTSIATIVGLERTAAAPHIKTAAKTFGITAIDDPAPEENLFESSDNIVFATKGVPAPTFSMGFRSFDAEIEKYYHQPGDEADSLDYHYLLKFFKTYILAGRLIANDPVAAFWTAGDPYEKVGKELYSKQ